MKDHIKAFQFSLLVHIAVILVLLGISTRLRPPEPVLVIDLSDGNALPVYRQQRQGNHTMRIIKTDRIMKTSEQINPVQPPIHEEPVRDRTHPEEVRNELEATTLITGNETIAAPVKPAGGGVTSLSGSTLPVSTIGNSAGTVSQGIQNTGKTLYLKKHFLYIRDIIQKNILYPPMARKMGWEGKVIISFLIMPDGCVGEIKIAKSSGKDILDRNAVETVKRVSPFPRPPVKAEITVPVVYAFQ